MTSLTKIFRKAALLGSIAATAFAGDALLRQAFQKTVGLDADDLKMAKMVYGDGIDYSKVRIVAGSFSVFQPDSTAVTIGNTIYWPHASKSSLLDRKLFIHELAHIYQNQNKIDNAGVIGAVQAWLSNAAYEDAYAYKLEGSKKFTDYNIEQQACIMADYFQDLVQPKVSAEQITQIRSNPMTASLVDQTVSIEAVMLQAQQQRNILAAMAKDGLSEKKNKPRTPSQGRIL